MGAWTRIAIISMIASLPDEELVIKRLLRNPKDFEAALKPLYHDKIASKFSQLFENQLVKASKAGNNKAAEDAEKRWYANADEIESQALGMSDMMAKGIVKQFPQKFTK